MADDEEKKEDTEGIDISRNKVVWIAGAIVLLIAGWFGLRAIFGSLEGYKVTLIDAPKEVSAATNSTFTWRVDGPATTINHTAVHLGTSSQGGDLGKDVKPENTPYNLLVQDFANGNYNVPLQFVGNIILNTPGTYYYRVHAQVKDKHYWTDEYTLEVKTQDYKVSMISAPSQAVEDEVFAFTWRVDGLPTTITHTSVHYGTESTPGILGKEVAPDDTNYEDLVTDFTDGEYNIPLQFVGNTKIATPGTYYYRGHAIVNGQHYWTDEAVLEVKSKKEAQTTATPTEETAETAAPTVSE